ncbi:MAG TPA: hypothetical protein VHZ51_23355, partial [Ktedonobacteraceae bacterium]|nr:hypothetical protein [Ktedonobacteraceae bacterium]
MKHQFKQLKFTKVNIISAETQPLQAEQDPITEQDTRIVPARPRPIENSIAEQDTVTVPAAEQDTVTVPTVEQDTVTVPTVEQDTVTVPAVEQDTVTVPAVEQDTV